MEAGLLAAQSGDTLCGVPGLPGVPRRRMQRRERLGSWRFLTFSCYKRLRLLGNPAIRDAFAGALRGCRERHRFRLIAWVAMPEHVHLIIVPRPVLAYEDGLA